MTQFKELKNGDWFSLDQVRCYIKTGEEKAVNLDDGTSHWIEQNTVVYELIKQFVTKSKPKVELNPIDAANCIKRLVDRGYSIETIVIRKCQSKYRIARLLRLLNLTSDVQKLIISGKISEINAGILSYLRQDFVEQELENAQEMHPSEFLGYIQANYVKEDTKYVAK